MHMPGLHDADQSQDLTIHRGLWSMVTCKEAGLQYRKLDEWMSLLHLQRDLQVSEAVRMQNLPCEGHATPLPEFE